MNAGICVILTESATQWNNKQNGWRLWLCYLKTLSVAKIYISDNYDDNNNNNNKS
jgi:hypothetical protein